MATLRNKRKLAAVTRETEEEHARNGQSRNTSLPRINEEYMTQVSEEIEGGVTKKLSQEFSMTESRILYRCFRKSVCCIRFRGKHLSSLDLSCFPAASFLHYFSAKIRQYLFQFFKIIAENIKIAQINKTLRFFLSLGGAVKLRYFVRIIATNFKILEGTKNVWETTRRI